ncbi:hypothetical protein DFA_00640 [Cavenderia fasciculata]|uniref:Uncharacterized protein n=1 Tax=Cavenderia fasciculata TaxID=261658 RepID=F4PSY6_CACFS|nr:uncharacterized protein DFA_00640 [Cavenderia fasciculata]EGG20775.1 hypothetical protein DFA_00640 [Cavenderia fasciculata]|eukprot:XP_004358625.1 hypothetical protein DFA_00640 [Cavenderia fasciculata]
MTSSSSIGIITFINVFRDITIQRRIFQEIANISSIDNRIAEEKDYYTTSADQHVVYCSRRHHQQENI